MSNRILHKGLQAKVMTAEAAAALIPNGAILATSGFTGAGYPKAVPMALAKRAVEERTRGKPLRFNILTGASTGPELDQAMALVDSVAFRFPYNGDATMRERINTGAAEYQDILHDVEEGITRVKNIVSDLRTFTHPEADSREHVVVAEVVAATLPSAISNGQPFLNRSRSPSSMCRFSH